MKRQMVCCPAFSPCRCRAIFSLALSLLLLPAIVRGQSGFAPPAMIQSVSGQFTVTAGGEYSRLRYSADIAADTNLVQLEPALLAVAAEHFKNALWHKLGFPPGSAWQGKVFLALQPARSRDDGVTIASELSLQTWNYRVELPDVLGRTRYVRALAAVLLLEIANRSAGSAHAAEVPAWLVDGLAQQILATDAAKVLLSTPARNQDGLPQSRLNHIGGDPGASAPFRAVLENTAALTLEQLSWPTDEQMAGADGGGYRASVQLFVIELLALPDGPACLRDFLARLPACRNWQTAFYAAFQKHFSSPLAAEKWWALRVMNFATHRAGSRWTPAASRARLAALLIVPVASRADSNALPTRAEISLQAALRRFNRDQLSEILSVKLRALQLAQFQFAPPFATLAGSYRQVLADFEVGPPHAPAAGYSGKFAPAPAPPADLEKTLKQLDALDSRRREAEAKVKPGFRL